MNQKIIHIQKSDDITSVTESLKEAKVSRIRLVSDTGSTVLKSASNIKLINKVANKYDKNIIIVKPHSSIKPVLADLDIKMAKDTTSAPQAVEVSVEKPEKDIVLAPQKKVKPSDTGSTKDSDSDKTESDGKDEDILEDEIASDRGISIPNFDRFRSKTLMALMAVLVLVCLWFVAFKVLPSGTIKIRLQTDKISVKESVSISNTFSTSDFKANKLKAQKAIVEKEISKEITTTGVEDIGDKATGTIKVENENSSTTENFQVGTKFESSGGFVFIADEAFSVEPASVSGGQVVPGVGVAKVTAEESGEEYNLGAGEELSIIDSSGLFTSSVSSLSGGTTEEERTVAQADIDAFIETLKQPPSNEVQSELERQFDQSMIVLDDTSSVEITQSNADPKVGEKSERTTVKATIIYSIFGISKNDIEVLVNDKVKLESGEKLYSVDSSDIVAKTTKKINNGLTLDINVDSFIGPELIEDNITEEIQGLKYSSAIEALENKPGVVDAEVNLNPFWVNKIPGPGDVEYEIEVADKNEDE